MEKVPVRSALIEGDVNLYLFCLEQSCRQGAVERALFLQNKLASKRRTDCFGFDRAKADTHEPHLSKRKPGRTLLGFVPVCFLETGGQSLVGGRHHRGAGGRVAAGA
jgi:hypothetical protein